MVLGKYGYQYPGRGRPIVRSDENRREEIIDVAVDLFAEKSGAAVTLKDLANACHLNPATIYYYFHSKSAFLDLIARERLAPAFAFIWKEKKFDSPAEVLTRMVDRIFEKCEKIPALPTIWTQDILPANGAFHPYMRKYAPAEDMAVFHAALRRFQEEGRIKADMIPEYIPYAVFSLTLFPMGCKSPGGTLAVLPTLGREDLSANALNLILKAVVA